MITVAGKMDRAMDFFLRSIKRYNMLEKGDALLVALSGGPDSVCLFDLLYQIRVDWHLELHVVHLNHTLRGEASDKDQVLAEKIAKDLKVPISVKRADVAAYAREHRMSIEEAARECRLEFFKEEADRLGIKKVVLGHHKDDQAETVLLRIIRGTGLKGLGAMKPIQNWHGITLIRPLIEMEKRDIEAYVSDRKLAYCLDATNQEIRFMRNRVRHRLIPEMERHYNPRIKNALAALAETVALDLAFLEDAVGRLYPKVVKRRKDSMLILKKKKFLEQHEALRFRILQKAVRELDPESEIDFFHWGEFRRALEAETSHYEMHVSHDLSVAVERKEIVLRKNKAGDAPQYEYTIRLGEKVVVREAKLEFTVEAFDRRIYKDDRKDRSCGIFDLEKIHFPMVIRNRREGDTFHPLGLHYSKKLKDFLIARKVPSYEKNQIPLFLSAAEIFWVYGVEISDRFKVTARTRRFLKIASRPI